jgi:hypothetical protein
MLLRVDTEGGECRTGTDAMVGTVLFGKSALGLPQSVVLEDGIQSHDD